MRVISGKYKGKNIIGFDIDGTRPTMDRVKESMFAMIQNIVKDSVCLDLFSGSGALGLEALSNGAKKCYFVDKNNIAINKLKGNINNIKVTEDYHILNKDYLDALKHFKNENIKFDLILLDPPYNLKFINNILDIIYEYDLLNTDGYIVCEYENEKIHTEKFDLLKSKKYGSKIVEIYRKS